MKLAVAIWLLGIAALSAVWAFIIVALDHAHYVTQVL